MGVLALGFALNAWGMVNLKFFGTWKEEIRYDILKESQAHRDGLQRNLASLKSQYDSADTAGRVGITATIKHQYSQEDTSEFPQYLKDFLRDAAGIY